MCHRTKVTIDRYMADRMLREFKILGNRFVFMMADITFVSVYSLSDTISSFSDIYIALRQSKQRALK